MWTYLMISVKESLYLGQGYLMKIFKHFGNDRLDFSSMINDLSHKGLTCRHIFCWVPTLGSTGERWSPLENFLLENYLFPQYKNFMEQEVFLR